MYQESDLSDVQQALHAYFEAIQGQNEREMLSDLLNQLEECTDLRSSHAREHGLRARELLDSGDEDSAAIHQALIANMHLKHESE